jgi:hypothetical protein
MKFVTDPLRALVRKKLWPVALLLVAALVAVPYTLAKDPEPVAPPPANAAAEEAGMPTTFVTAVDEAEAEGKRRRVLGATKDPFEPAPLPKSKKGKKKRQDKKADEPKQGKGGSKAETPKPGGSAPKSEAPPVATVTFPANSIIVGFGKASESDEPQPQPLEKMKPLPDEENPLVVFLGLRKNGKVAEFMLTGEVVAEGDGKCLPRPEHCQTLRLRKGETEFLTISGTGDETDGQYQLDVHEIFAKKTTVPAEVVGGNGLRKKAGRISLGGRK